MSFINWFIFRSCPSSISIWDNLKYLPINCVTIWGLSADNWKRSPEELSALMKIFEEAISSQIKKVIEDNSRFFHIGRRDRLPKTLVTLIEESIKKTENNPGHIVNLAIDFGGEDQELRLLEKAKHLPQSKEITEEVLWSLRDGKGLIKHADLIIRTGGTKHISDVGWLHGAPTELYFLDKLFPDVKTSDIVSAIVEFTNRQRRMGARP